MNLLLTNATIINPSGQQTGDVLIQEGKIAQIGKNIVAPDAEVHDCHNALVFPGFIDMHVHLREPGEEEKETLSTGLSAAVHGGITAVCSMPNTKPVIDNEVFVKFLIDKAWEINKARLYPAGSITKGLKGEELSEMVSMLRVGAVAFSDDGSPVDNMQVLRRALQYIQPFNKPLILHCEDKSLASDGAMNESETSTVLGLPGIHAVSEEASIAQSIEVAKYFGRIHIAHVSTAGSVELIRFAKQRGIAVTAETAPHYFTLTESSVEGYNTSAKMNPPLRSEIDRRAIIEGLRDGTIDAIATDHAPHAVDDKHVEFNNAKFGIVGLETAVMLTMEILVNQEGFSLEKIAKLWSESPASILGVSGGEVKVGAIADLTVIDPKYFWTVEPNRFFSKSKNTPFTGFQGKGAAIMTIVNGQIKWEAKNGR